MSRKVKMYEVSICFPETEAEKQNLRKRIEDAYNNLSRENLDSLQEHEKGKRKLNTKLNIAAHKEKDML
ncbi:hypothetical protein [Lutispora saccharofermentans]|uniref:J domain-containing protein n=1 Tax=Lutispora saccharofermentans TaxID=3024236 RepID=A0ABT1NF64_9FIRM|nr:hypothetical protein [Lutispora saccharofermentans]MCQ1529796.1 hypothetical protein [Lutispora saccharofermentans]